MGEVRRGWQSIDPTPPLAPPTRGGEIEKKIPPTRGGGD